MLRSSSVCLRMVSLISRSLSVLKIKGAGFIIQGLVAGNRGKKRGVILMMSKLPAGR
jgi:hypothetical protein